MLRFVTIQKFATESGYTEKAVRAKIYDGTWLEGKVWGRAPDSRILIDVQGYEDWVEAGSRRSAARSPKFNAHGKLDESPPPLVLDKKTGRKLT